MAKGKTLRWGNAHSLVMVQKPERALAALKIVKANGEQRIAIALPRTITVLEIYTAWKRQDEKWDELLCVNGNPFLAIRVIWLPQGAIVWNVLHTNETSFDTCGFTALRKEMLVGTGFERALTA